ncbi:MAG TPA: hypothetical protein VM075_08475 [Anaerolineae bacterium]|nr:hypothetical protein [Anaerolineae bacterium]
MNVSAPREIFILATLVLLPQLTACASWWGSESDSVRRAVIAHELDDSGMQVDDLVIRLSPREFRADFGHDSRIVWLVSNTIERPYREREYFRLRDPERSYLFIQDVRYDESHSAATVTVVIGLVEQNPTTKDIALRKKASEWEVVSETRVR